MTPDTARRFLWWVWWAVRFYGQALTCREWDDPRVQAVLRERFPNDAF